MAIRIERRGAVMTIVIDRVERRNAIDRAHSEDLAQAFREFERDDECRVAVLWGAGGVFCAGADLKSIAEGEPNRVEVDGDGPMGPTRMTLSKPVIAAISGYAVAGGLEIALWCDMRVAEANAILGVFCRRWGVPLIDGGTVRLPRIIGQGRALDMILTGRPVDAQEALAIGLVNRVVPTGTAKAAAEELAAEISQFPQLCMRLDRQSTYEQFDKTVSDAMDNELRLGSQALDSESVIGAARFNNGAGRHGTSHDFNDAE